MDDMPRRRYLSLSQVADRLGVPVTSMSRLKLPPEDAVIGPVDDDGAAVPRQATRGWLPSTIDAWAPQRPGRGRPKRATDPE